MGPNKRTTLPLDFSVDQHKKFNVPDRRHHRPQTLGLDACRYFFFYLPRPSLTPSSVFIIDHRLVDDGCMFMFFFCHSFIMITYILSRKYIIDTYRPFRQALAWTICMLHQYRLHPDSGHFILPDTYTMSTYALTYVPPPPPPPRPFVTPRPPSSGPSSSFPPHVNPPYRPPSSGPRHHYGPPPASSSSSHAMVPYTGRSSLVYTSAGTAVGSLPHPIPLNDRGEHVGKARKCFECHLPGCTRFICPACNSIPREQWSSWDTTNPAICSAMLRGDTLPSCPAASQSYTFHRRGARS